MEMAVIYFYCKIGVILVSLGGAIYKRIQCQLDGSGNDPIFKKNNDEW